MLSQTRNAWLGALVGLDVLAVLRAPRALWALAAAVALILVLRPAPVMRRLTVTDDSSRDRYYMWQAGIDMVRERPVFGQGPGRILAVYPDYRWPEAPTPARRTSTTTRCRSRPSAGLPCLAWWLWWVAAAMGDAWREFRRGSRGAGWVAAAALGFLAAFMAAGLFEYNFGDSESPDVHAARRRPSRTPSAASATACRRRRMTLSPTRARGLLRAMQGRRVLVVGDVMLDEFLWGRVARISPEAPVPVVEITSESFHLGGAGQRGGQRPLPGRARPWWRASWDGRWPGRTRAARPGRRPAWRTRWRWRTAAAPRPSRRASSPTTSRWCGRTASRRRTSGGPVEAALLERRPRARSPAAHAVVVSDYQKGVVTPRRDEGWSATSRGAAASRCWWTRRCGTSRSTGASRW